MISALSAETPAIRMQSLPFAQPLGRTQPSFHPKRKHINAGVKQKAYLVIALCLQQNGDSPGKEKQKQKHKNIKRGNKNREFMPSKDKKKKTKHSAGRNLDAKSLAL